MAEAEPTRWPSRDESRVRVLVSVDNELLRCGLSQMLSELALVSAVDASPAPAATVPLLVSGEFDVVVLAADPASETTAAIVRTAAQSGVHSLFLLRCADDALAPTVAELPVDGFLLEPGLSRAALADSLQRLRRGDMPIPGVLARRIMDELRKGGKPRSDAPFMLTPRERQALNLLAEGLSNKQIARRLGISEHGAKRHVGNVLAKLNCPNRTVAVTVALNHGLLAEQPPTANDSAVVNLRQRITSRPNLKRRKDGSVG